MRATQRNKQSAASEILSDNDTEEEPVKKVIIAGQRAMIGGNARDQFGRNSSRNSNISVTRRLSRVNQGMSKDQGNQFELDSHADTCVLGKDFHIL